MPLIIRPYKSGSKSAKALAVALGIKRMALENSRWKAGDGKYLLNWGAGEIPNLHPDALIINRPGLVARATNKLEFFERAEGAIHTPRHWTDKEDVAQYMEDYGCTIVCRTMLRANSGRGIIIATTPEELVDAPLYTLYIKKKFEYRVHVAFGEVIDVQQKARRLDIPDDQVNWQVRNHDNGFIFKREGVELEEKAQAMAKKACRIFGLDFGAVDIIYNERKDRYYVLEINTAPGLEGQTLESYREAFERFV